MTTAHETAAVALEAAAVALRAVAVEANGYRLDDVIDTTKIADLPVGLKFKDRDGDVYEVSGTNEFIWASSRDSVTLDPKNYQPLTVIYVPEPTPASAPAAPVTLTLRTAKVGDRVRASGTSYWGTDCDGKVGTVSRIDSLDRLIGVRFDDLDGEKMFRAERLTKIEDTPDPTEPKIGDKVKITAGINSYTGFVGHVGTLTQIERGVSRTTSLTGTRYTVDGIFGGAVEKVDTETSTPSTRMRTTVNRTEILAEHSFSENGAFIRLSERGYSSGSQVAAVHLTRAQTRELIATLQQIVEQPRSSSSAW